MRSSPTTWPPDGRVWARSAVLMGCSRAEAEDVVQTALTKCLLQWSRVQAADDRDAYVHRVVINTFTSARRRRWTGERPMATVPEVPADDELAAYDAVDALRRSLVRLGDDQLRPGTTRITVTIEVDGEPFELGTVTVIVE